MTTRGVKAFDTRARSRVCRGGSENSGQRPGPPPLPGGAARSDQRQAPPAQVNSRPPPDFSKLPPAIAESLAKLAGRTSAPPSGQAPATPPAPAEAATDDKPPAG